MALTYGFYNSMGGDRKYNSVQISRLFEGIINDGVFASIGESLHVVAGSGMTVNVGTGRAWFNNTWTNNDADIPLTLDQSDVVLNRIDAIVLEIANSSDVRANTIKIVKGTPASVPANPVLTKTTGLYQYPLAYVYVGHGVASITQANITNTINTTECPFVTVVGLDALLPEWQNEFDVWFAALQAQMSGNVVTNLQNQIDANKNTEIADRPKYGTCATAAATAAKVVTQAQFSLVTGATILVSFTNVNTVANPTLDVNNTGAKPIFVNGAAATATHVPRIALFQYDGTNYQLINASYPSGVVPIANGGTGSTSASAALTALGVPAAIKSYEIASYMAFCANVNTASLDAAFGKNNESLIFNLGTQLAMYAWYKGTVKASTPFTTMCSFNTFAEILANPYAMTEILAEPALYVKTLIQASPYAAALWNAQEASDSAVYANMVAIKAGLSPVYTSYTNFFNTAEGMNALKNNTGGCLAFAMTYPAACTVMAATKTLIDTLLTTATSKALMLANANAMAAVCDSAIGRRSLWDNVTEATIVANPAAANAISARATTRSASCSGDGSSAVAFSGLCYMISASTSGSGTTYALHTLKDGTVQNGTGTGTYNQYCTLLQVYRVAGTGTSYITYTLFII